MLTVLPVRVVSPSSSPQRRLPWGPLYDLPAQRTWYTGSMPPPGELSAVISQHQPKPKAASGRPWL